MNTDETPGNCEDGLFQRSPFSLFINQIKKKKSAAEKGKSQHPLRSKIFHQASDHGKSKDESRKGNGTPKTNNSGAETQSEAQVFSAAVAIMPLLPDLEEIDLSWNDFIGGILGPLTLQFKHLQRLQVLRLSNCMLTAKDISFLGEGLQVIPHLEILDLSWNTNVGGSFSLLTQNIPKGCALKTLKVTDCSLTPEDGESLAQLLNKVHNLEELDLSINKRIGCSLKSIAQELKYVSSLKVLNLNMCGLKHNGLQWLGTSLQHLLELRKLDVSCNKEIGGGFQNLVAHLASLSNLEVLDLHQCCITEEDMAVLTQIIPLLSSLQELNLSSNKSVGISSDQLLSRLRFLPRLTSVLLSNCSLQHDSFTSLAEAALHLPELMILDLSWNKCVGGKLKLILEALNLGAKMQVLRLSSCSLVDEDITGFAAVIEAGHLDQLQKLDLSYNHLISDQGWTTFCQALVALDLLSELDISLRPSLHCDCEEWFSQLLAALPKLPLLTELGLQGWVLSRVQQKQLEQFNWDNERNVRFDI
ncbi:leucine-rich repeat-containing protein 31 [Sceloporus undulatus]|uniref:leucine-rich repeat-containing protein 31 n=1 Tax=Sceloporus undulatus TaxID=8520 RepID=UPI001C4DB40B|nr:leucine-rich repeat-containing protein 31 [Sceloporus undulatus]